MIMKKTKTNKKQHQQTYNTYCRSLSAYVNAYGDPGLHQ
jgi:hypothetical protein